jgi:uncharacterized protein YyaL (SSP411 family)
LTSDEYAVVERHYGLDRPANFEGRHWHLHVVKTLEEVAALLGRQPEQCQTLLAAARAKLLAARQRRVRPGRDEKVLTGWNALMIAGMAQAARVLDRPDWLGSARRALEFVRATLWRDGRLLATYKDGRAHLNAYLDDYAFLLNALLAMMEAQFRGEDLEFARRLAQVLLEQFEDPQEGGFFFTSHDHERLIHRAKPGHDNATASGNGVAAFALQRLGHLLGDTAYLDAAERVLELFRGQFERAPGGSSSLLSALGEHLVPVRIVVLRGPDAQVSEWHRRLAAVAGPDTLTLALGEASSGLPGALDHPVPPRVNAWVCSGVKCLTPIDDFACLERVCKGADLD